MHLDLRDLRYFQTIAELGHLGRAADQLGRSQPALTKAVHRLESALGRPLFERKGRGIELTAIGRVLQAQSRRLLLTADNSFREIQEFVLGQAGHVRIGSGPITAEYLLPQICDLIVTEAPRVTLEVTVGTSHLLREQIKNGEIDLIVGLVQDRGEEFVTHVLTEDIVVAAAGVNHTVFQIQKLTLKHLLQYGWVLPIGAVASRQWLDRAFVSRGLPAPRAQIEVNSIPMLAEVIARTGLLCFVSRHTLLRSRSSPLREIKLNGTTLKRKLGLTYSASQLSPPVQNVIDIINNKMDWKDPFISSEQMK
jgi:DNA-binding transcriptional LysR family regulator